jgi:glycosyltransferase involved in cell wall biosynthesis
MVGDRQIGICIPNYNRVEMVIESFIKVYDDKRISEIIISDDHSTREVYNELQSVLTHFPKVKMFRNEVNIDCYANKHRAVELSTSDFIILLDSDNIIDRNYLDKIFECEWDEKTILTPDFAKPTFNFQQYGDLLLTKQNISAHIDKPLLETCLNAANYFVNRKEYLKVWDEKTDPVTSDSIYMCYKWLESGNKIRIVKDLTYDHRVWDGSHYKNNNHRTPSGFHESILNKLRNLI